MDYEILQDSSVQTIKAIKRYLYEIKNNRIGELEQIAQEEILKARLNEFLKITDMYLKQHPKKTIKKN